MWKACRLVQFGVCDCRAPPRLLTERSFATSRLSRECECGAGIRVTGREPVGLVARATVRSPLCCWGIGGQNTHRVPKSSAARARSSAPALTDDVWPWEEPQAGAPAFAPSPPGIRSPEFGGRPRCSCKSSGPESCQSRARSDGEDLETKTAMLAVFARGGRGERAAQPCRQEASAAERKAPDIQRIIAGACQQKETALANWLGNCGSDCHRLLPAGRLPLPQWGSWPCSTH